MQDDGNIGFMLKITRIILYVENRKGNEAVIRFTVISVGVVWEEPEGAE